MKKIVFRILLLALLTAGGWLAWKGYRAFPQASAQIATARVRRGEVVVRSYTRGELRAARSVTLTAPNLFGTVQVTRLAPLGAFAREKDLIIEFDDSEVNSRLEEKELELEQTDQQIRKAEADLAVRDNQDQVELLSAKFGVRRSELEVKRNELLSAIDAKKNGLSLEESRRRLQQLESDIQSRQQQARAQLAVLREKKNKSLLELRREKERLAQVKLLAPMSGLVAIKQNRPNFYFPGMQIPDIREGDQLNPGIPVADILDLSELEIVARVGEIDRANLHEGQEATVQLDAIPGKRLNARIKTLSGTATANIFSGDPAKKFDVVFAIDMPQLFRVLGVRPEQVSRIMQIAELNRRHPITAPPPSEMPPGGAVVAAGAPAPQHIPAATVRPPAAATAGPGGTVPDTAKTPAPNSIGPASPAEAMTMAFSRQQFSEKDMANARLPLAPEEDSQYEVLLRPGLLAEVQIVTDRISNAVSIPNQAVFEKEGRLIAYVKRGKRFDERVFQPLKRSESVMVVASGLKPGEEVALADPTAKKDNRNGRKPASGGGAMGALPGGGGK